ncbi:MAG: hypothetical protein LC659_11365 [Myxococcales bacterium]|nr:hypothetical protein [Myxococcales bacterium]
MARGDERRTRDCVSRKSAVFRALRREKRTRDIAIAFELAIAKSGIRLIGVMSIDTTRPELVIASAVRDIGDAISKNAKQTSFWC